MLSLLIAATLAADARPVAVMSTSKRPGADAFTQRISERVQAALQREAVPGLLSLDAGTAALKAAGRTDPRACQAARVCVGELALILGSKGVVVSVDTARAGSSLAILLEAVSGDGARVLASTELTLPVDKESDDAALPIVLFARKLKEKLEDEAPKPVAAVKPEPDAPVRTNLEPPPPTPPLLSATAKPGPGKAIGGVVLGIAAASGVTAIILAVVSGTAKAEFDASLNETRTESSLPQSKLEEVAGRANGGATGALISGAAAVGLGVVGVILLAGN